MASSLLRSSLPPLPPTLKTSTSLLLLHPFSSSTSNPQTTPQPPDPSSTLNPQTTPQPPDTSSTQNPQTTLTKPLNPCSTTTQNPQTTLLKPLNPTQNPQNTLLPSLLHSLNLTLTPQTTPTPPPLPPPPPTLPPLLPSNDADSISKILLQHHNPFHFMESSLQLTGISLTHSLVHQVLLRVHHSSKIALAFFEYCQRHVPGYDHDTASFNILIDALCKVMQFDVAWQLVVKMDQVWQKQKMGMGLGKEGGVEVGCAKPNFTTFYLLVRRLIAAGRTRQAIRAFDEMHIFIEEESDTVWKSYFCYLLDTLCKYGYVEVATKIFNGQKSVVKLDAKLYTILICGWCKAKRIDTARSFLDEMVENGIDPNVVTYNVLLNGICRSLCLYSDERFSRVIRQAELVFDEMQERGIDPDVTSYSTLLHVYSRAHKPQLTLEKFRIMKERGISPNVVTYTSVIKCLCSCAMLGEAEELLNEMVSNGVSPTAETYNCFFKEYRGRKDAERAMNLYGKMKENGYLCSPNLPTYNILLVMFVRSKRMGYAMEIWNDVKASGIGPDLESYTALVHGYCEKGMWKHACEYFIEMIERGYLPRKATFEKIYKGLMQSNMLKTWKNLKKKLEEESVSFSSEFDSYQLQPYRR